eukprot:6293634-Prymnesium_polylepis.1
MRGPGANRNKQQNIIVSQHPAAPRVRSTLATKGARVKAKELRGMNTVQATAVSCSLYATLTHRRLT